MVRRENTVFYHEPERQQGEMMSYSVLTQHSAQDGIRCIGTHCTEHVRGINILDIRMNSYVLEMRFDLWHGMVSYLWFIHSTFITVKAITPVFHTQNNG